MDIALELMELHFPGIDSEYSDMAQVFISLAVRSVTGSVRPQTFKFDR